MLTQAQLYADAGKRIFPLKVKEKQPAFIPGFNHGFKDATTSKEAIKKAWATTNFNIGLVTGEVNNLLIEYQRYRRVVTALEPFVATIRSASCIRESE